MPTFSIIHMTNKLMITSIKQWKNAILSCSQKTWTAKSHTTLHHISNRIFFSLFMVILTKFSLFHYKMIKHDNKNDAIHNWQLPPFFTSPSQSRACWSKNGERRNSEGLGSNESDSKKTRNHHSSSYQGSLLSSVSCNFKIHFFLYLLPWKRWRLTFWNLHFWDCTWQAGQVFANSNLFILFFW